MIENERKSFASELLYYYFQVMAAINHSRKKKTMVFDFENRDHPVLNEYGMIAQGSPAEDDYQAFLSIQTERYLKRKTQQRFCSEVEEDVIMSIISDSWDDFMKNRNMGQMDTERKIRFFYSYILVFPYFVAEEESIICLDFRKKRAVEGRDDCFCGSGFSYRQCCGGIKSLTDLLNGSL